MKLYGTFKKQGCGHIYTKTFEVTWDADPEEILRKEVAKPYCEHCSARILGAHLALSLNPGKKKGGSC